MMMMILVLIVNILSSSSSNRSMHIRHQRLTRRGLILPVHTVIHYVLIELFVYATAGHPARMPTLADHWQGSGLLDACTVSSKLHASVYHVLPPVSTISGKPQVSENCQLTISRWFSNGTTKFVTTQTTQLTIFRWFSNGSTKFVTTQTTQYYIRPRFCYISRGRRN